MSFEEKEKSKLKERNLGFYDLNERIFLCVYEIVNFKLIDNIVCVIFLKCDF